MIHRDNKINKLFINWLFFSLFLILSIIVIGGLTRLTDSGLSITEWELFKGIVPPYNEITWNNYFELYKQIPQYKLLNNNMNLDEFKIIFYWEYIHRMIARFIGLFFLIPLIYFYFSKKINKKYLSTCYLILFLIILQGTIGWFMVKSGLVNDVTVSHYRLSLHLFVALLICSILYWLIINVKKHTCKKFFIFSKKRLPLLILIFLLFIQIILGAFVSGLDAGKIYQTWPLMGSSFLPNDIFLNRFENFIDFNNHSLVQFYHRNLAYLISLYILYISYFIYKNSNKKISLPLISINIFLILQVSLGIFTLISNLNILLASAHQITSVFLILSSISLYYSYVK